MLFTSKRPLTPPLIFGKLYCAFRDKIVTKVRMFIWRHCCVLYDPISHEMPVVQMFNMVIGWKHTLKRPFCIIFMVKKPCLKVQILQYKFLDWKWPPPFRNFSENSSDLEMWGIPYKYTWICSIIKSWPPTNQALSGVWPWVRMGWWGTELLVIWNEAVNIFNQGNKSTNELEIRIAMDISWWSRCWWCAEGMIELLLDLPSTHSLTPSFLWTI